MSSFVQNDIFQVTSDIHCTTNSCTDGSNQVSRYRLFEPTKYALEEKRYRRNNPNVAILPCKYITCYHRSVTSFPDVGLQVWRGAFLLADYLVYKKADIRFCSILELGCGTGLIGIVLSLLEHRGAIITDYKSDITDLALHNIKINEHLSPLECCDAQKDSVHVDVLDWSAGQHFRCTPVQPLANNNTSQLLIASDVIYDDVLTDLLFSQASRSMRFGEHMWMAMEKRFNFTQADLSLVAHGYRRFMQIVNGQVLYPAFTTIAVNKNDGDKLDGCCDAAYNAAENSVSDESGQTWEAATPNHKAPMGKFIGNRIPQMFPQVFMDYDRVPYLELWDITLVQHNV